MIRVLTRIDVSRLYRKEVRDNHTSQRTMTGIDQMYRKRNVRYYAK